MGIDWAYAFGLIVASPMMCYEELGRKLKGSSHSMGYRKDG